MLYGKEKVSVIVAVYNSEKFLDKLIQSILEQTYQNIEVILVDDGSPDNSGKICDNYSIKDSRIKVIHKTNDGACEARNCGLREATGDYISIIDGDDWLEKDYVEYLLKMAVSTKSDMAMTDKIFTTRDRIQTQVDHQEVWTAERAAASIIYPFVPIGPWNKLYSAKLLKNNNITFSVPWSGEGLFFSFMAAQYSNQVAIGHKKIYNYRLNNVGSGLTHYNVQMGINALANIKNIGNNIAIKSKIISGAVDWHIWKNYHFLLKLIIATESKEKYIKEYLECFTVMKKMLPTVLVHSKFGPRAKVKMLFMTCFPIKYAKRLINKEQKELEKDLVNVNV